MFKCTILPAGANASAFTLADDTAPRIIAGGAWPNGVGGTCEEGFQPGQARSVQKSQLFRSQYIRNIPRLNFDVSLKMTVTRSFDLLDSTLAFLAGHCSLVPSSGLVTVTIGNSRRYLSTAIITAVRCVSHVGRTCKFQYDISADNCDWTTS